MALIEWHEPCIAFFTLLIIALTQVKASIKTQSGPPPVTIGVYGIKSVRDQVTISQSQFSTEVSGFLELEDPAIGILLEPTVFDESDHPISFGFQYWCGDVARFSVDIRY